MAPLNPLYLYGPGSDELVAQIHYDTSQPKTETARNFYYSDGLGSIIATLDPSGTVLKRYAYSPFGLHGLNNDYTDQPFGYTGQRYDSDTGLYYYKARYYHAQLGRFLSTDPIGYDDQMNLYAYVGNSSVGFRDPSGLLMEAGKNLTLDAWNIVNQGANDLFYLGVELVTPSGEDMTLMSIAVSLDGPYPIADWAVIPIYLSGTAGRVLDLLTSPTFIDRVNDVNCTDCDDIARMHL